MKIAKAIVTVASVLVVPSLLIAGTVIEAQEESLACQDGCGNTPMVLLQAAAIVLAANVGRLIGGKKRIPQMCWELAFGLLTGFIVLGPSMENSPFKMITLGAIIAASAVVITAVLATKGFKTDAGEAVKEREGEGNGILEGSPSQKHLANFVMVPHLKAESSDDAIVKLVRILREKRKIDNESAVLESIRLREQSMATGLDHGLALPHGRTNAVKGLVGAVALVDDPNGIPNYETIDKSPVRIVVLSVSSESETVAHLHLLSEISRSLRDDDSRQKLLSCSNSEEMIDFISHS